MKKFKRLFIVTFILSGTLLFVSCAKDENSNITSLQRSADDIKDMQTRFVKIMESEEYKNLHVDIKEMANSLLDNKDVDFKTRETFAEWIDTNLPKTDFSSKTEAMNLYDKLISKTEALSNDYNHFYEDLNSFDSDEIYLIIQPSLQTSNLQTTSNPCQNNCMDICSANIDALNQGYVENLPNATKWQRVFAEIQYWVSINAIVDIFNGCMTTC